MKQEELFRFMQESEILSFLDRDARKLLDRLFEARPQYRCLLAEQACEDLRRSYFVRAETLYLNAACEKIFPSAMAIDPYFARDNGQIIDDDVFRKADGITAAKLGKDPGAVFRAELPVLAETEEKVRENCLQGWIEMLDNIFRYRGEIAAGLFGGKEITAITSFTGMSGDVHRHGRAVAGVRTDAGTFYYKPHDCRLDVMYRDLVRLYFSDCTAAADCVPGEGCGFMSELKPAPLRDPGELPDYFRHFGILTALFHSIGGSDMHCENILPCGTKPAAVDLETLFKPLYRAMPQTGSAKLHTCASLREELRYSVRGTAILPSYTFEVGISSPLFRYENDGNIHLPFIGEERFTVRGYEEDFIRGFGEGCRRIIGRREEMARLIGSYGDMPIRYLLRSTSYYCMIRRMLSMKKNLVSAESRDAVLSRLEVPYRFSGYDIDRAVVAYEADCLMNGDIPYFCAAFSGNALCGGDTGEVIHERYFRKNAKEMCMAHLDRVSEADIVFQTDIIRSCFAQAAEKEEKDETAWPLHSEPPAEKRIMAALDRILDGIEAEQIHLPDGTIVWQSIVPALYDRKTSGPEIYAASVGGFAALLSRAEPGNRRAEAFADYAACFLDSALSEAEETLRGENRSLFTELSFAFGFASVVLCCDLMAGRGGASKETFDALMRFLANRKLDIARDAAQLGNLAAALCMARTDCPAKDELAGRCREELARILPQAGSLSSVLLAECALLFADAPETSDRTAAYLDCLRSAYSAEKTGWPDEKAKLPWLAPRGPQSAWIALCMLQILRSGAPEGARPKAGEILDLALESLMDTEQLLPNDSLYHGNALAVCALTAASGLPGGGRYLDRAGQILSAMLDRYDRQGAFIIAPKGTRNFFDVSFVRGTAGIGCAAAYYLLYRRK